MTKYCKVCKRHRGRHRRLCVLCKERRAFPSCRQAARRLNCWLPQAHSCRDCFERRLSSLIQCAEVARTIMLFVGWSFTWCAIARSQNRIIHMVCNRSLFIIASHSYMCAILASVQSLLVYNSHSLLACNSKSIAIITPGGLSYCRKLEALFISRWWLS